MEYIARDFIKMNPNDLWELIPDGHHILTMDDGEKITTTGRELIYSSYIWDLHRAYPNTPLLKTHHVSSVLKGGYLNKSTHIKLLQAIYWDVSKAYNMHTPMLRDRLTELVYDTSTKLYSEMTSRLGEYVTSIDILDFLELDQHHPINTALNTLEPSDESIKQTYKVIEDEIINNQTLSHNAVVFATRSGIVNKNQVLQCVGPRGYVTEVDGYIMKVPILRGFFRGMRSIYNATAESHSAGKALFYAEAPLQDGEYFSRRLQLMTMAVENIETSPVFDIIQKGSKDLTLQDIGDCGSTDYLSWNIKGQASDGDEVFYPGDLKFLQGKFYLDPDTKTLKQLTTEDTHLVGKTIKIRTVLGCHHKNKHGVCYTCFGAMADNISPYANIGHLATAVMTHQITQSILSTKHLIASSSSEAIYLPDDALKVFKVNTRESSIYVRKEWKTKALEIVIPSSGVRGLSDMEIMDDMQNVNPMRISGVEFLELRFQEGKRTQHIPVHSNFHGCLAILTIDFLMYLKAHGWKTDDTGNYIFTLEGWDFNKPIFMVPQKEYSYARHAAEISGIIESRLQDITDRVDPDSPKSTLMELFDLVNSKLSINIVCLEVIIYAIMCADIVNNKFGLARNHKTAGLGIRELIIFNRSLSPAYAYERLGLKVINKPSTFFKNDRDDSLFDVFIDPYRAVKDAKRKGLR